MQLRMCVAGPFSGPRSCYGDLIHGVISNHLQKEGLSIHFFDDQANPEWVKRHLPEIVKKSDVVIGHFNSDCAKAALPVYRAAGIPLLLPASTAAQLGDGQSVFQLCSTEAEQVKEMKSVASGYYPDSALYYWCDGSAYSHRLLKLLQEHYGHELPDISTRDNIDNVVGCVTFYLGTHFSILQRMHQEGMEWHGAAICCDDCDIEEFTRCARPGTWICSSKPGYDELLNSAVDIAWRVMYQNINTWADYFDERGQYLSAGWQSYCIK